MTGVLRIQHTSVPMPPDGAEQARAFYAGALGMNEISPPTSLSAQRLVWFSAGDDGHEVHLFADSDAGNSLPAQHLCLQVDDIEEFRTRLADHGVAVQETIQIHNRPRFFIQDPFSNSIELTQITGEFD